MRASNLLLAFAAFLALAAVACGGGGGPPAVLSCQEGPVSSAPDASPFPLELQDDARRTIRLEAPPEAIASLSAGHTEILYALGAGDQIVAVDKTSDCPLAATRLPQVDAFSPSPESIAALEPDLVVLFFDPGGLRESLEQLGIPILFLNTPESVEGVFEQAQLLGRATGHREEAEELVAGMRERIGAVTEQLADVQQGPSVFHEVDSTYYTAGPGSFVGDLYDLLKARNIAEATGQPYPQMSGEAIIEADPDVIVLADEDAGESPETVAARPGWGQVAAVKEGRVYAVDPDIVSRPGPRLVEALETLARLLYPERFP